MIDLLEDDSVTSPVPVLLCTVGPWQVWLEVTSGARLAVLRVRGLPIAVWPLPSRAKPS